MKYEFKKIDSDTTELAYKDKTFTIKKNVELMKEFQSINAKARTKMMIDLSKQGITKKDLTIERKENNKTYYDNSNILEIEEQYTQEASVEVIDEICKRYFNMGIVELITDVGIEEDKEAEDFMTELIQRITGIETEKPSNSVKKDAK